MILRRLTEHVKTQNWFAVVLDAELTIRHPDHLP